VGVSDRHIANSKSISSTTTLQRWAKIIMWTLVHNQKSYRGWYWPTQAFFGRLHFGLGGYCPLKFLHVLQIDQALLAHTRTGMVVPPKKIQWWKFKIWLKIQRVSPYNFGASGSILTKLFPSDVPWGRGNFWQLSTLMPNISGTDWRIAERKSIWSSTTPSALGERNLVNFGPLTKTLSGLILTHPSGRFSGDYISALGAAAPQIFTHVTDLPCHASAHPNCDGVPQKF